MLMPFHLLIYDDRYSPFWSLNFPVEMGTVLSIESDCPRDPWACHSSAVSLGGPAKESLPQIHRCENIQGRVFVSHNKSVEWRQWDFWLPFSEFNYAHFQPHWTVLRWGRLNLASAFTSHHKPGASLRRGPEPRCPERVLRFENRGGARPTWKLMSFKHYFYLIKKNSALFLFVS